jgi:hypothetical protein
LPSLEINNSFLLTPYFHLKKKTQTNKKAKLAFTMINKEKKKKSKHEREKSCRAQ